MHVAVESAQPSKNVQSAVVRGARQEINATTLRRISIFMQEYNPLTGSFEGGEQLKNLVNNFRLKVI